MQIVTALTQWPFTTYVFTALFYVHDYDIHLVPRSPPSASHSELIYNNAGIKTVGTIDMFLVPFSREYISVEFVRLSQHPLKRNACRCLARDAHVARKGACSITPGDATGRFRPYVKSRIHRPSQKPRQGWQTFRPEIPTPLSRVEHLYLFPSIIFSPSASTAG